MPSDNIKRAIQKGTGELPGVEYHELLYEGYGPGGIGIIVEVTTDNKNRAASEVRSTFSKHGGNLASPGAVQHFFTRQGQFLIAADKATEEKLMDIAIENGAEDVVNNGDHFEIRCPITEFDSLSSALESAGIQPDSSELAWIPSSEMPLTDKDAVQKLLRLVNAIEDLDDVQNVYDNSDIDDALLEEFS